MTTSTDTADSNKKTAKQKKPKKKGPFRTGLILVVTVLVVGIGVYFKFLFDGHLRWGLEYGATQGNGAEVNIGSVRTSFLDGRMVISNVQVTNSEAPEFNTVQLGKMEFDVNWDALLRARFVVDRSQILDLKFNEKRKRPGRVLPVDLSAEPSAAAQKAQQAKDVAVNRVTKNYEGNVLGDVAQILGAGDFKQGIKEIDFKPQSEQLIKSIENTWDSSHKEWKQEINKLKTMKELKALVAKAKGIKPKKKAKDILKQIQEVDKLRKQAKSTVKDYKQTYKGLKTEITAFAKNLEKVDNAVEDDIKDLRSRLKIPDVNLGDLSSQVFKDFINKQIGPYRKYWVKYKQYLPQKKTEEDLDEIKPNPRSPGRIIRFPITNGYPVFWVKDAKISSAAKVSKSRQTEAYSMTGQIKDLTFQQKVLGRPTTFSLNGDIPSQSIQGIGLSGEVNALQASPFVEFKGRVGQIPLKTMKLAKGGDLKLAMAKANVSNQFFGRFETSGINVQLNNTFNQASWDVEAKKKDVTKILQSILNGINKVTLQAKLSGSLFSPKVRVRSSFGKQFVDGIRAEIDKKIKEADKYVRGLVEGKVGDLRKKLDKKIGPENAALVSQIVKGEKGLGDIDSQFRSVRKKLEREQKNKLKSKGKKELKRLKDKLKLPF